MGTKIVFLNLADMHEHGLAHTSVTALRKKYPKYSKLYEHYYGPNRVDLVDLFGFLEEHRNPRRIGSLSDLTAVIPWLLERVKVIQLCSQADKIMLGAHGNDYFSLQGRARTLIERSSQKASKQGKFIYTYDNGTARVQRKYEGGRTVMRTLYQGAL